MKTRWRMLGICAGAIWATGAKALSPYLAGEPLNCTTLTTCVQVATKKLHSSGFQILGVHQAAGVLDQAVVVISDKNLLRTIQRLGGSTIIAAGIRVGVTADGKLSYINPDYWYRAYWRKQFESGSASVTQLTQRLAQTLGNRGGVGGDVPAVELPTYRYMLGMERFDSDKNTLAEYADFTTALTQVRGNLARHVAHTRQVYEVVLQDKHIAVFGVAMNDARAGEASWLKKIGVDAYAALPWEIYIVNGKVSALYARYRTALAWPNVDMATFIRISDHPERVREQLTAVAGGKYQVSSAF